MESLKVNYVLLFFLIILCLNCNAQEKNMVQKQESIPLNKYYEKYMVVKPQKDTIFIIKYNFELREDEIIGHFVLDKTGVWSRYDENQQVLESGKFKNKFKIGFLRKLFNPPAIRPQKKVGKWITFLADGTELVRFYE